MVDPIKGPEIPKPLELRDTKRDIIIPGPKPRKPIEMVHAATSARIDSRNVPIFYGTIPGCIRWSWGVGDLGDFPDAVEVRAQRGSSMTGIAALKNTDAVGYNA